MPAELDHRVARGDAARGHRDRRQDIAGSLRCSQQQVFDSHGQRLDVGQLISLGKVITHEKSNEMTAIAKLLAIMVLKGVIVTIDAADCQTEISRKMIDCGGDYILKLKGNQPTLRDRIEQVFHRYLDDKPWPHTV